jgi:hypothetical protein
MASMRVSRKIFLVETMLLTLPVGLGCLFLALIGLMIFGAAPVSILMRPQTLRLTDWEMALFFGLLAIAIVLAIGALLSLGYLSFVFVRHDRWGLQGTSRVPWLLCSVASLLVLLGAGCALLQHLTTPWNSNRELLGMLTCLVFGVSLLIPLIHLRLEYSTAEQENTMIGIT